MPSRLQIVLVIAALSASACTTSTAPPSPDGPGNDLTAYSLPLSSPAQGVQVATRGGLWVDAGDDIRWCEVVELPGGADQLYAVDRIEAAMSRFGQELVVSAVLPGSETDTVVTPGERMLCNRAGEAFGEALEPILSSQQGYLDQRYPPGVGKLLRGGQRLVLEYHYANPVSEPIPARVKLNFHFTPADGIVDRAHLASFVNLTIYTPPHGHSTHLGECTINEDLLVSELGRRTRSWGTDFRVWRLGDVRPEELLPLQRSPQGVDGEQLDRAQQDERAGETLELLWHSADHLDNQYEFEPPLALSAGDRLRFECSYHNTSDRELGFGATADDESCALLVTYWNADQRMVLAPPSKPGEGCLLLQVDEDGIARN